MSKLVVGAFLSLDGVMQAPGGPDEDREGGFEHGGWVVHHFDDEMGRIMTEWIQQADAVLLGRKTYEIFAAHWPHVTDEDDLIAAKLNSTPRYVASRTLDRLAWAGSMLIEGDVAEAVRRLKEQDGGEIQVHGSGNLVQTLLKHDLIDSFRIWTMPVLVGEGKRLFAGGTQPGALRLAETHFATSGAVLHVYERAGSLDHGYFGLDERAAPRTRG